MSFVIDYMTPQSFTKQHTLENINSAHTGGPLCSPWFSSACSTTLVAADTVLAVMLSHPSDWTTANARGAKSQTWHLALVAPPLAPRSARQVPCQVPPHTRSLPAPPMAVFFAPSPRGSAPDPTRHRLHHPGRALAALVSSNPLLSYNSTSVTALQERALFQLFRKTWHLDPSTNWRKVD